VKSKVALPERVRVKLSSEAAEAISLTRVVIQEMPVRELVDVLLGVAGKDAQRLQELLLRGSVVSGASRYRWEGWPVETVELDNLLATFPSPEPQRRFNPAACVRATLQTARGGIDIPRDAASRRGLLRRRNFWDLLLRLVVGAPVEYRTYSYRDRADLYEAPLTLEDNRALREAASLLAYTTLRDRVATQELRSVELFTSRDASAIRPR
jgi:hypothetical protein